MTDRRYSIIPARAVVDRRLEGRDLQVLGFLGTHTDKLGWCFLTQGGIAKALDCGRSTVQRSLTRLVDAGWVMTKDFTGPRPHACHAYRVIMDRDDPEIEPPEYAVGGDDDDGAENRCPPVGTSGGEVLHPRAPVPSHGRAPPPPEVPTHAWAHKDQDSSSSSGDARARDGCRISREAFETADEIARIAGHDLAFLPPRWVSDGPALRVQMMLDQGWLAPMMVETARSVMQHKHDGAPQSIRYFEKPFAQAHARQSLPVPLPVVKHEQRTPEVIHEAPRNAGDWKHRRDRGHSALDRFGKAIADAEDDQRGQAGAEVVQLGLAAGRG